MDGFTITDASIFGGTLVQFAHFKKTNLGVCGLGGRGTGF